LAAAATAAPATTARTLSARDQLLQLHTDRSQLELVVAVDTAAVLLPHHVVQRNVWQRRDAWHHLSQGPRRRRSLGRDCAPKRGARKTTIITAARGVYGCEEKVSSRLRYFCTRGLRGRSHRWQRSRRGAS
jgi:hypothetical protein